MSRPTCKTCRYFDANREDGKIGRCRKYAPQPGAPAVWLGVRAIDWCGEHRPESAETPAETLTRLEADSAGTLRAFYRAAYLNGVYDVEHAEPREDFGSVDVAGLWDEIASEGTP